MRKTDADATGCCGETTGWTAGGRGTYGAESNWQQSNTARSTRRRLGKTLQSMTLGRMLVTAQGCKSCRAQISAASQRRIGFAAHQQFPGDLLHVQVRVLPTPQYDCGTGSATVSAIAREPGACLCRLVSCTIHGASC